VREPGNQGIEIGIGPDFGGVEEQLPPPDEPGLLAEVDDPLEEPLEDPDAEPLPDARQAGMVGQRLVQGGGEEAARQGALLGLFRPPLPEPCGRLSPHTALQWPGSPDVHRDLGLSPPYSVVLVHLPPFALCVAFPRADYSGGSVAVRLAPFRRSPVPPV